MELDSPATKFFSRSPKKFIIGRVFFEKKFSPCLPQCSSEKSKLQFWKLDENFPPEARKKTMDPSFVSKKVLFKNVPLRMKIAVFTNLTQYFNRSPKNIDEFINLFQQKFIRKVFFWKNRMQLWQTCWKLFTRSPNKIYETLKSFKKSFFQKLFLRKWRLQFWQWCRIFFTRSSTKFMTLQTFWIKKFFQKIPVEL